jgi:hypothetical protein
MGKIKLKFWTNSLIFIPYLYVKFRENIGRTSEIMYRIFWLTYIPHVLLNLSVWGNCFTKEKLTRVLGEKG